MTRKTNFLPERHLRALVLDNDATAVRDLRRSLEARQFSVLCRAEGTRGLALLVDELLGLDALVMDMELPGRDARSFADLIRRAGGERDLAIVVLATDPSPALRTELRALGVDAVVDRRAGPEVAADAVEAVVAMRRRTDALAPQTAAALAASPPADPDSGWTLVLPWSPQSA